MIQKLILDYAMNFIRHGLTTAAGYLVSSGLMKSSESEQFIGAALGLAGIALSILKTYLAAQTAKKLGTQITQQPMGQQPR